MQNTENLAAILRGPFLLLQVGSYGHGYEGMPLPPKLAAIAEQRAGLGEPTYPKNQCAMPPYYHVPADVDGILMNKIDELQLNGVAYWAQSLSTRVGPKGCINSTPSELCEFYRAASLSCAVLVTKPQTTPPKGSLPGRQFRRWTQRGYVAEPPTHRIDTDVVYTEAGKSTLVFAHLEVVRAATFIDLAKYHIYFTGTEPSIRPPRYHGKRLPYRSSGFGTCSLVAPGAPETDIDIQPLKAENASRRVVAVATLHPHVCGRVSR